MADTFVWGVVLEYRVVTGNLPQEENPKNQAASDRQSKKMRVETHYNLGNDIGEQTNLLDKHPEIARRLKQRLAAFETDLRKNQRPAGVANEK